MKNTQLSLLLLAAGMAVPALAQPTIPSIIEFDAPGAGTLAYQGTEPQDINAAGAITGFYVLPTGDANGFVRAPDGTFTTFAIPGAEITVPESINPIGAIAGYSCYNAVCSGFSRTPAGDITTFVVPGGGTGEGQGTFVWNINPSGEIAGTYVDANNVTHGFVRAPGGAINSFDAPGAGTGAYQGTYMASYEGLNVEGQIAGWYVDANNVYHGYVRAPDGTITTFNAPGAGTGAYQGTLCYGVNPAGETPGVYYDATGALHGFLRYRSGTFVDVAVPGAASTNVQNISPLGAINGDWYDTNNASHGFVRALDGNIIIFDAPGAGTASGQGTFAGGINTSSQTTGYYIDGNNVYHGFLWTP